MRALIDEFSRDALVITAFPAKESDVNVTLPWVLTSCATGHRVLRVFRFFPGQLQEQKLGAITGDQAYTTWMLRWHGLVLRIAGLFHIVQHESPGSTPIDLATIRAGIRLAAYYESQAIAALHVMRNEPLDHSEHRRILDILAGMESPRKVRDLHARLRTRTSYRKVEEVGYGPYDGARS